MVTMWMGGKSSRVMGGGTYLSGPATCTGLQRSLQTGSVRMFTGPHCTRYDAWPHHVARMVPAAGGRRSASKSMFRAVGTLLAASSADGNFGALNFDFHTMASMNPLVIGRFSHGIENDEPPKTPHTVAGLNKGGRDGTGGTGGASWTSAAGGAAITNSTRRRLSFLKEKRRREKKKHLEKQRRNPMTSNRRSSDTRRNPRAFLGSKGYIANNDCRGTSSLRVGVCAPRRCQRRQILPRDLLLAFENEAIRTLRGLDVPDHGRNELAKSVLPRRLLMHALHPR